MNTTSYSTLGKSLQECLVWGMGLGMTPFVLCKPNGSWIVFWRRGDGALFYVNDGMWSNTPDDAQRFANAATNTLPALDWYRHEWEVCVESGHNRVDVDTILRLT